MKQRLKRVIRRMIPDRLMARYRLVQHSRHVRTNLVLFIEDPRLARRWVSATPDTIRVRTSRSPGPLPEDLIRLGSASQDLDGYFEQGVDVVVAAPLGRPRLVGGRRSLPIVRPVGLVAPRLVLETLGAGGAPGGADLVSLYRRVVDAGWTVGVVPSGAVPPPVEGPILLPSMVVISAVPVHDVGGGSRTAQLAMEMAEQGFHVTYLSLYPALESVDLGLRFIHPALEQFSVSDFDVAAHLSRVSNPGLCLLALPSRPAVDLAFQLRAGGYQLVYDLIDDWSDPGLGAEWFDPAVESRLIEHADLLTASAPDLVRHLERHGRPVTLLPNAVNARLFGSGSESATPSDLPVGEGPILGYHGSLYGSWFDWAALKAVAEAFPAARVVVIGDIPGRHPDLPANVFLLGLKPQIHLPPYVGHFTVGLVPFIVSETTHAVSPLKAFEYLAMGVPVAAPPLRALEGLDGVYTADGLVEAVELALAGPPPDPASVLVEHSWGSRLQRLLAEARIAVPAAGSRVQVAIRPPVHYSRAERLR